MFQGDPTIREGFRKTHSESLGMEARSILKSIQTETAKLEQSEDLARSDLHYFRARFNYYRLSLMRLLPAEREILEPVLSHFMELIAAREINGHEKLAASNPSRSPAFLEKVVEKFPQQNSEAQKVLNYRNEGLSSSMKEELISELSVLKMALSAEASNQGNRHIARSLEKVIDRISRA